MISQRCLNDIIMFWDQQDASLRGMPHTHTHCDSAYCCAHLSHQHDVCRLKQTCKPKGAAQKYLTIVTDVMILNNALGFDVARVDGAQPNSKGVWPCKLPVDSLPLQLLANRQNSCQTWVNSLAETFRVRLEGRQMKMSWCNKCFHHKQIASQITPVTVTLGVLKESEKVKTLWHWLE